MVWDFRRGGVRGMSNAFSQDIISMIISLHQFVERYTGNAAVGEDTNYLVNNAGVVNNSLHYESGRGSYLPTNAATSESQVLLALGYIRAYEATGIPVFKERAIKYTDAYIDHYFPAYKLPQTVGEWRHHWVINGKYPFRVLSPVNSRDYQQSGAFDLVVNFTDGVGYIPHNAPVYGEDTARVYFAYGPVSTAKLVWDNVFADVQAGTGEKYAVDFFIDDRKMKMDANGVELGLEPTETIGKIQLASSFTGSLKIAHATRRGSTIPRNMGFDAWPMWRKLNIGESASAMDVELWHIELFKAMYDNTGDPVYLRAFNSASYSMITATALEPESYYFKRNVISSKLFNHGISYFAMSNTSMSYLYYIDQTGLNTITKDSESSETMAELEIGQTGIFNRVSPETALNCELLVNSPTGFCEISITTSDELGSGTETFRKTLLTNDAVDVIYKREFKLKSFYRTQRPDGSKFLTVNQAALIPESTATTASKIDYVFNIIDGYTTFDLPLDTSYCVVGFWTVTSGAIGMDTLSYRLNSGRAAVTIEDDDGWIWGKELDIGTAEWRQYTFDGADFTLWPYQNETGAPPSTFPSSLSFNSFSVVPIPSTGGANIDLYCYGEVPTAFDLSTAMLTEMKIKVKSADEMFVKVGDVQAVNCLPISYKYSPGVVPFTTDKSAKDGTKFWRGTPYVAYQSPSVWALIGRTSHATQVLEFYKDSQDDYYAKTGLRGPFTQVYIWPKWDNVAYGQAEGFSANGPDPNTFWGGFQARSFNGAASLLFQMTKDGHAIPTDLYEVVDDYAAFLVDFLIDNDNSPPTLFPQDGSALPSTSYDEPHIAALHINALTALLRAGHSTADIVEARNRSIDYLNGFFVKNGDMKGSFSSYPEGRLFYGFWVGEIMRAMSESVLLEDQLLREVQSAGQEAIEIEFGDETTIALETGEMLAYNKIIIMPVAEMEFAGGTTITTEAGDIFALE